MSRPHVFSAVLVTGLALGLSSLLTPVAHATHQPRTPALARAPELLSPAFDERVAESTARFEADPGSLLDARLVLSREAFDPTGWTSEPQGSQWVVAPFDSSSSLSLAALRLGARAETPLWWALIGREPVTGALRATRARRLLLVPRFANRIAPDARVRPSAAGMLPEPPSAREVPSYRTISLASGDVIVPAHAAAAAAPNRADAVAVAPGAGGRRASLVQFAGAAPPDTVRARIEHAGGTLVAPIGRETWLVRMDDAARERLASVSGQPWIGDWKSGYKLCPLLDRTATAPIEVTALLFPDGDADAVAAGLTALGATAIRVHVGAVNRIVRFTLDASRVEDAAALADVQWLEPTARDAFSNDLAQWVVQTNLPGNRRLWDMGIRGRGQVVMTSDSGIRTTHEMFFDSTQAITGWGDYPSHRKIIAYKPSSDSPNIEFGDNNTYDYHGTHTGGTVAGNADPSSGAPYSGMAKEAKLYFMDMAGTAAGLATPNDLNDLFEPSYIGNAGGAARISSNSWGNGSSNGRYLLSSMQVDQFMWSHPDYLIAFAAGNVGILGSVQAPGTAKSCLTVGATGNGGFAGQLAPFSSGGPTADVRYKPTVCAPGVDVISSIGTTRFAYASYNGTSMATPAVAGALALMRQYLTEGWYPTGAPVAANAFTPSAALLKAMAVCTSRNDVLPYTSPSNRTGWGRLTADDVLYFPGDSSHTLLLEGTDGLLDRQYVEYQVQVTNASRPLKVVLCWTDAPGHPASAVQIVNDLDLSVTHGASTYLGNRLLNFASATGGARDSLNVEEVVHLPTPAAGLYTVRVEAHRVLQGPQPFGLCITGGVGGSAGAIALDRFEYGLTDTLDIEVLDGNAASPLTVTITSTTEDFGERTQLVGANGVFRGSFPIGPAVPRLNDGVLAVSSGDMVKVTYGDHSPVVSVSAMAQVNARAPVLSNVHATVLSSTSARVTWTTDVPATSRVRFGLATPAEASEDSSGLTNQHAVLLTGLTIGQTYHYDVESVTRTGETSIDSLNGDHRAFTTRSRGDLLLVMDDPDAWALATWTNALAALGWTADVITGAQVDPPLVGDATTGMRSYAAVLWQVDPDRYPPFSLAQRAAIDSLIEGGGRLLVTGHDMGWGMADMNSPTYSEAGEAWIETGLKARYYLDVYWADTLRGIAGDPVTGEFATGAHYHPEIYPDAGDVVGVAPNTDGVGSLTWLNDSSPAGACGLRWESSAPKGAPGSGVWGGRPSRIVGMFYEWCAFSSTGSSHAPVRTAVLARAVEWLIGRRPPTVIVTAPAPGAMVTADFLAIRYVTAPDAGRTIASRSLDYSLDGGESWASITTASFADSGYIWDLGAALGGQPVPNSDRVLIRLTATDDGTPQMRGVDVLPGTITLARPTGDRSGPALVAGSARTNPMPLQRGSAGALLATFSDAETGAGTVVAAEYSLGASPAPAGSGLGMTGAFGTTSVAVSADLGTDALPPGPQLVWLRARDGAGNWGAAAALGVTANDRGVLAVDELASVDFLAPASPNPSAGTTTLRFGLARAGKVRMELFDLAGRRVRTLAAGVMAAGQHVATWDGRDESSNAARAGVYFLRLVTPTRTWQSRLVRLD